MLGHGVHSIIAGGTHIDAIITTFDGYIAKDSIAVKNIDAILFKKAARARYPNYFGLNYLDMTAGMLYPAK